jgi:putative transposase
MVDFKGAHFAAQIILVCVRPLLGLPTQLPTPRGNDARAGSLRRPFHGQPLPSSSMALSWNKRCASAGGLWARAGIWTRPMSESKANGGTSTGRLTGHARRFLQRAIGSCGVPEKITIDKSRANGAAIESHNAESGTGIEVRRSKYLNNMVEQDHRAIKRVIRPMLGFKAFRAARRTLAGIELMHMIRKEQMRKCGKWEQTSAEQFYSYYCVKRAGIFLSNMLS